MRRNPFVLTNSIQQMKYTYKQAFDLITEAYIKGEIIPTNSDFCFCGTLSPTKGEWNSIEGFSWGVDKEVYRDHRYNHPQPYSLSEYKRMEWALIHRKNVYSSKKGVDKDHPDALFVGMCAALEVLKEIHRERGEDVDGVPEFTKRQLTSK